VLHNSLPVEDVHIINKNLEKYTITDEKGNFNLLVKVGDTVVFSAVQFQLKSIEVFSQEPLEVVLIERINELEEVVLYNNLSGDPARDMVNSEVKKPINFYDLNIPGYTGRTLTQTERRLNEATTGAGILPLNPIINAITGRTKMLKRRAALEKISINIDRMQELYEQLFIDVYHLPKENAYDFFVFCSEDEKFNNIADNKLPLDQLDFFINKYKKYEKLKQLSDE